MMAPVTSRRTFLFAPESAYGPTNNCIGIGRRLLEVLHHLLNATVTGPAFGAAVGLMEQLDSQARLLVAEGVAAGIAAGPTFEYVTFDQLPPIP